MFDFIFPFCLDKLLITPPKNAQAPQHLEQRVVMSVSNAQNIMCNAHRSWPSKLHLSSRPNWPRERRTTKDRGLFIETGQSIPNEFDCKLTPRSSCFSSRIWFEINSRAGESKPALAPIENPRGKGKDDRYKMIYLWLYIPRSPISLPPQYSKGSKNVREGKPWVVRRWDIRVWCGVPFSVIDAAKVASDMRLRLPDRR